jgi:hypothetical protein
MRKHPQTLAIKANPRFNSFEYNGWTKFPQVFDWETFSCAKFVRSRAVCFELGERGVKKCYSGLWSLAAATFGDGLSRQRIIGPAVFGVA